MSFLTQKPTSWVKVVLALALLCFPRAAQADCASDVPATCAYVPYVLNGGISIIQPKAFVFPAGDQTPTCKQVTNNCGADIMVPTKLETEWQSFLTNHEQCATLAACPALQVALASSPTTVLSGGTVAISWNITGAFGPVSCTGSSDDAPSTWTSPYYYATVPAALPTGTATVRPGGTSSTTYTLTCSDSLASNITGSVTVTIDQPLSVAISASPASVPYGTATTLYYTVTDSSNVPFQCSASATDSDPVWTGTQYATASSTMSGSTAVTPAPSGAATGVGYYLTCSDSVQSNVQNSVNVPVTCNPGSIANGTIGAFPGCGVSCNGGFTLQNGACIADTCSPASIANGSIGAYPACGITCNPGYSLQNGACAQVSDGVCGPAYGVPTTPQPSSGLCNSPGPVYSGVNGNYPYEPMTQSAGYWLWFCLGQNGGNNSPLCQAPYQAATCSPSSVANGQVDAYPGCGITCDAGYTLQGSSCVANAVTCPATTLSWSQYSYTYGEQTYSCAGPTVVTPAGQSYTVPDTAGYGASQGGYGSATYQCSNSGTWTGPSSLSCVCQSLTGGACSPGQVSEIVQGPNGACRIKCHK